MIIFCGRIRDYLNFLLHVVLLIKFPAINKFCFYNKIIFQNFQTISIDCESYKQKRSEITHIKLI